MKSNVKLIREEIFTKDVRMHLVRNSFYVYASQSSLGLFDLISKPWHLIMTGSGIYSGDTCFFKKAYVRHLKTKSYLEVTNAFASILIDCGVSHFLQSGKLLEFYNQKHNLTPFNTSSNVKICVIERYS